MQLNISDFKSCKDIVIEHYDHKGIDDVRLICVLCGIPLVAAYTFILEDYPGNEELEQEIKKLCKFYGYTEIVV